MKRSRLNRARNGTIKLLLEPLIFYIFLYKGKMRRTTFISTLTFKPTTISEPLKSKKFRKVDLFSRLFRLFPRLARSVSVHNLCGRDPQSNRSHFLSAHHVFVIDSNVKVKLSPMKFVCTTVCRPRIRYCGLHFSEFAL